MAEENEKVYRFRMDFETNNAESLIITVRKIKEEMNKIGEETKKTSDVLQNFFALAGGVGALQKFSAMATEITEVSNRLRVLNETVINTGQNFGGLVSAANRSRTSLKEFSEFFMRIGMSSAEYFHGNPGNLIKMAETLNKQFQLMHLNPQQLMSVQTAILDAMELGFFDWRHMRAGIQHDNPLFRKYLKYMGFTGEQAQDAARSRKLTAQSFTEFVVKRGDELTAGFDKSHITLRQFSYVLKNDVLSNMETLVETTMVFVNYIYHAYSGLMNLTAPLRGLGTSAIFSVGATMMGLQGINKLKSGLLTGGSLVMGALKRTNPYILAGAAAFGVGQWAYHKFFKKDALDDTEGIERSSLMESIAKDVHEISQNMGTTRETLNDLVARTESILTRNNLQGGMGFDGNISGRQFSEMLAKEIKRDLDTNGIGF